VGALENEKGFAYSRVFLFYSLIVKGIRT